MRLLLPTALFAALCVAPVCMAWDPFMQGLETRAPLTMMVADPLAAENACACVEGFAQREYGALAAHLAGYLDRPVQCVFCSSIDAAREKLGDLPDIVVGKCSVVAHEARMSGLNLTRLAMLTDKDGATTFHGLFVVRNGDPSQSVDQLGGRRITFGPECCEEKHGAAFARLQAAGVPPRSRPARRYVYRGRSRRAQRSSRCRGHLQLCTAAVGRLRECQAR